jgi:hypothetical protein
MDTAPTTADHVPAPRKRQPSTAYAVRSPTARSRMSNGTRGLVLPGVDQRSAIARRFRDVIGAIVADLGGPTSATETKLHLVRRFAALVVQAEAMESKMADGGPIDASAYAHLSSTMLRLAARIGLKSKEAMEIETRIKRDREARRTERETRIAERRIKREQARVEKAKRTREKLEREEREAAEAAEAAHEEKAEAKREAARWTAMPPHRRGGHDPDNSPWRQRTPAEEKEAVLAVMAQLRRDEEEERMAIRAKAQRRRDEAEATSKPEPEPEPNDHTETPSDMEPEEPKPEASAAKRRLLFPDIPDLDDIADDIEERSQ